MQQVPQTAQMASPSPTCTPVGGQHIAYLDGLRGIAILAVVMVHSSFSTGIGTAMRNFTFYGVRGVQLFFIVSGMTLTMAHLNRPLNLPNFAARRFFRIAPMFYMGMIIYIGLGAWTNARSGTHNAMASDYIATLLFLNGWLPHDASKVVPGGWSIGAEAMFYVTFPAIIAIARNSRYILMLFVSSYIFAGLAHFALIRLSPQIAMTFWICQLPAFIGGCFLAAFDYKIRISRPLALLVLWGSIILMVIDSQLRGHSNLLVAIFILTAFVWAVSCTRPYILRSGVFPYLGKISFSIYIIHFAILEAVQYIWRAIALPAPPIVAFALVYILTVALSAAVATFTYRYVEQPFIKVGRWICKNS